MRIAVSMRTDSAAAIEEIVAAIGDLADVGFLLVFASSHYDADELAEAMATRCPGLPQAGCSTAGELAPQGPIESGLVALAFLKDDFQIVCAPLRALSRFGLEEGGELVAALRRRLGGAADDRDLFGLTLLDGLCQREEVVLAALQRALHDIPLVGGSTGDDLSFQNTFVICDGEVIRDAGLLMLVRTSRPFRVFKSDHFEPTATKLVVTACDPDNRVVSELDAEPAWEAFADATRLDRTEPSGNEFAAHPLLVRVGGEYYCRSIQKMNMDGSLSFYCAIDTGVVLTVAETRDMVDALEETLLRLDDDLDGIDFVLGFDCVHRKLEAESRQILGRIADLFRRFAVIGFNTYGEQYNAMHLNHTFTGVAFGRRRTPS
ncbi:FIST N-terminal domain-containing protein [Pinisolibacter aquiterrae]|uniref:FIST N-terminal domain-containing protein n=2 Tax=Pinisolibacter aquiterrae TaxID=2815579 RepID=UPI001E61F719